MPGAVPALPKADSRANRPSFEERMRIPLDTPHSPSLQSALYKIQLGFDVLLVIPHSSQASRFNESIVPRPRALASPRDPPLPPRTSPNEKPPGRLDSGLARPQPSKRGIERDMLLWALKLQDLDNPGPKSWANEFEPVAEPEFGKSKRGLLISKLRGWSWCE